MVFKNQGPRPNWGNPVFDVAHVESAGHNIALWLTMPPITLTYATLCLLLQGLG